MTTTTSSQPRSRASRSSARASPLVEIGSARKQTSRGRGSPAELLRLAVVRRAVERDREHRRDAVRDEPLGDREPARAPRERHDRVGSAGDRAVVVRPHEQQPRPRRATPRGAAGRPRAPSSRGALADVPEAERAGSRRPRRASARAPRRRRRRGSGTAPAATRRSAGGTAPRARCASSSAPCSPTCSSSHSRRHSATVFGPDGSRPAATSARRWPWNHSAVGSSSRSKPSSSTSTSPPGRSTSRMRSSPTLRSMTWWSENAATTASNRSAGVELVELDPPEDLAVGCRRVDRDDLVSCAVHGPGEIAGAAADLEHARRGPAAARPARSR